MPSKPEQRSYYFAIASGLAYGIALRLLYHRAAGGDAPVDRLQHWLQHSPFNDTWVMTTGFLLLAPAVMGWIAVAATPADGENHWTRWVTIPWLAVLLTDLCLLAAGIEGWICIVFSLPLTLACASLGGTLAGSFTRTRFHRRRGTTTLCLAILPILISSMEMQLSAPLTLHTTQTAIVIHAPAATVFRNIERVPAIAPSELRPTWTHTIGFPLPVEATLDHEGIGGIRHASFEHGLIFIETITAWETNRRITFTIAADTAHIPPTTLDEHVTIGGQYFDVLNGEYLLEPLPNGDILLHLSSQQRLSTDFNAYATLWSDAVMRNLQNSILQVVQHRCESAPTSESTPLSATLNP